MFQHTFRTLHARFDASGLGAAFAPRRPRNPLLKLAVGLLGVGVLALLVVVGVFVGAAMLAVGLARRLAAGRPAKADARIVDAEYRIVRKDRSDALPLFR